MQRTKSLRTMARKILKMCAISVVLGCVLLRAFTVVFPINIGSSILPFIWTVDGGTVYVDRLESPHIMTDNHGNATALQVYINDAGAMHRGDTFYCWLVYDSIVFGKRIIREGRVSTEVRYREEKFAWLTPHEVVVR